VRLETPPRFLYVRRQVVASVFYRGEPKRLGQNLCFARGKPYGRGLGGIHTALRRHDGNFRACLMTTGAAGAGWFVADAGTEKGTRWNNYGFQNVP